MKGKVLIIIILLLLIMAGIVHERIVASRDKGLATDWNANHQITGDVDMGQYSWLNQVIENRVDFPAGPVEGQVVWRSDLNQYYVYNGAAWVELFSNPAVANLDMQDFNIEDLGELSFHDGGSTVDIIRDEDNMVSDDDQALATQQSIKAYADAQINPIRSVHINTGNYSNISSAAWINVISVNNVPVQSGDTVLVFSHGSVNNFDPGTGVFFQLARNNIPLVGQGRTRDGGGGDFKYAGFALTNYDTPSTGTYTYSLQMKGDATNNNDMYNGHVSVIIFKH